MAISRVRILTPEQAAQEFAELNQQVFIQDTQPTTTKPYIWIKTNVGGDPASFALLFEDGVY